MTTYICKCGRQVKKATNADNTGNRDTKGCNGCPYLLPWGPDKYIEGQGYTKDVQGYECRMSPTISYTTTYRGQANDKCTLHILSLDLDFLDEVQAWIYDNAADTLSAGFSRGSMRGIDFSDKGRYSLSISCTQNKKGMAAKAALLDRFFTNGRVRKDMTLVQEKAHILASIKKGKENASKMNYIISQHDNGLLYAYYLGTFWFWLADKRWVPSDFAKQEYEKAQKKNPRITPEEFMDSDDFIQMDDYEVPSQKLSALKALTTADSKISAPDAEGGVLPASNEPPEIVDECSEPDCMCRTCGRESCFAHGCAKKCPANAEESCLTVTCPEYIEKALENPTAAAVDVPPCAPTASDAQTSPCQNADAGAKEGANDGKADWAASQNCPFYDVREYSDNSEGHFCHLCGSLKRPHKVCLGKYKDDWHKCDVFIKYDGAERLLNKSEGPAISSFIPTALASAEPPEIVDECSDLDLPYPGDVYRSAKGGQLYKIGELTNGKKTCYLTMRCNVQGGTWVPANSSVYPNLSDAQGEFEAWIRTKQLEPVAPTGAAAATTDASAAPEPPQAAETTTTSESGEGADTSMSLESGTSAPSTSQAPGCPAADGDAESEAIPAAAPATSPASLPAFDYTGLDAQTVQDLHLAEREFAGGKRMAEIGLRRMADGVAIAHAALCGCDNLSQAHNNQHSEKTFGRWCDSVGLNRKAAERLLQVARLFDGSTPREEKVLEELGPSLLYAAAKPSAPAELVQAVKDGDITTHKQYQEALAEIRARDAKINDLLEMSEAADRRAEEEQRKRKEADEARIAAENKVQQYREIKDAALETAKQQREKAASADARARAAEHDRDEARRERDGARDALQAVKLRGDRLKAENDDLKARPIEAAVVDEDEVNRRAEARAQEVLAAKLTEQREISARNAEDAIILLGRQINTAWQMVRPFLAEMDELQRVEAVDRINKEWAQTQKEIMSCL